jgi:hypothetical protein
VLDFLLGHRSMLPTQGAHFDRHPRTGRALLRRCAPPVRDSRAGWDREISLQTAPLGRGLYFRGECVGRSTATRVIATQFHASLCHPSVVMSPVR